MESRAKLFGHPIHQILIVLPLGLLSTAVVFDGIELATGDRRWSDASRRMIGAGLLSAMAAAPFGFIDWLSIPENTRAKRVGALHGAGNLVVTGLFGASWLLRRGKPAGRAVVPVALAAIGAACAGVTAWLGGELVNTHGIGVRDDAGLNAESSLSRSSLVEVEIPVTGPEPSPGVP
jgi:uncharacterized membrane protein